MNNIHILDIYQWTTQPVEKHKLITGLDIKDCPVPVKSIWASKTFNHLTSGIEQVEYLQMQNTFQTCW